jgi:gamma-glutamylcyclotransferase (GGCT)/AIG2-like uncharacterized protein YtfP
MTTQRNLVFVYGTLRQYERNAHYLHKSELVAKQAWTYGKLYDTGCGYPALVIDGHLEKPGPDSVAMPPPSAAKNRVYGELYSVDGATLEELNVLEGYIGEGEDNQYDRVRRMIYTDEREVIAYVYVYRPDQVQEASCISSGDWKAK